MNNDGDTDDTGETDAANNNMYQITVRASEMRDPAETGLALSTEAHITVQVMNREELGEVELNWLQPEVGTAIMASLSDPDGGITDADVVWVWTVAKVTNPKIDTDGDWRAATGTGADTATYTPHEDDEGELLRAVATYTDAQSGTTTMRVVRAMSEYDGVVYRVRPGCHRQRFSWILHRPRSSAAGELGAWRLYGEGRGLRHNMSENTDGNLGSPVEATDPNNDVLTYQLDSDNDPTTAIADDADVWRFFHQQEDRTG